MTMERDPEFQQIVHMGTPRWASYLRCVVSEIYANVELKGVNWVADVDFKIEYKEERDFTLKNIQEMIDALTALKVYIVAMPPNPFEEGGALYEENIDDSV